MVYILLLIDFVTSLFVYQIYFIYFIIISVSQKPLPCIHWRQQFQSIKLTQTNFNRKHGSQVQHQKRVPTEEKKECTLPYTHGNATIYPTLRYYFPTISFFKHRRWRQVCWAFLRFNHIRRTDLLCTDQIVVSDKK